jgi:cell filamentation protein
MNQIEARELLRAHEEIVALYDRDFRFSSHDICRMHQIWLGSICPWAGQYRKVNVTRDNFTFAAANQIPALMGDLEKGPLRKYTSSLFSSILFVRETAAWRDWLRSLWPYRRGFPPWTSAASKGR